MSSKPVLKPVFFWWAHKMMWGLLSNYPYMSKQDAIRHIAKKYPEIAECWPKCDCFACSSTERYADVNGMQDDWDSCSYCPLDWRDPRGCYIPRGLFTKWAMSTNPEDRQFFAARIRDVPLKETAHELYDVKERPDD